MFNTPNGGILQLADQTCLRDRLGSSYIGHLSRTASGRECAFWADVIPLSDARGPGTYFRSVEESVLEAANYCRNPNGSDVTIWCYVAGGNGFWEYCHLPMCEGGIYFFVGHLK